VTASTATQMIYVAARGRAGRVGSRNREDGLVQRFDGQCCERPQVSPDGSFMYVGSDLKDFWYVINPKTGDLITKVVSPLSPNAHNLNLSADGKTAFMSAERQGDGDCGHDDGTSFRRPSKPWTSTLWQHYSRLSVSDQKPSRLFPDRVDQGRIVVQNKHRTCPKAMASKACASSCPQSPITLPFGDMKAVLPSALRFRLCALRAQRRNNLSNQIAGLRIDHYQKSFRSDPTYMTSHQATLVDARSTGRRKRLDQTIFSVSRSTAPSDRAAAT